MLGVAAFLLYLSAPTPAAARRDVDPLVAETVRVLRATPPGTGDLRRIDVRGEGRTLVWQAEIAQDMAGWIGPGEFAAVIANAICARGSRTAFFTQGRTLRVEIRIRGGSSASATVDHCSVPAGQRLTAASFAGIMQPFVGMSEDGVTIRSIRAEGETVIILVDGAIGWRRELTDGMLEGALLGGFCDPGAANNRFFDGTRTIRIDTLEGGREPMPGRPIASCPER